MTNIEADLKNRVFTLTMGANDLLQPGTELSELKFEGVRLQLITNLLLYQVAAVFRLVYLRNRSKIALEISTHLPHFPGCFSVWCPGHPGPR